jgi:radical SAM protein with 4Fe4S-binding SPASM domain
MAVNAYGDVLACITLPVPAGNVRYAPLRTIWEDSPFLRSMRALNPSKDLHGCPECRLRSSCHRCPGLAYTETGDVFGPQPGACLRAVALAGETPDPTRGGPPGLSHADSRYWTVGDVLDSLGVSCQES